MSGRLKVQGAVIGQRMRTLTSPPTDLQSSLVISNHTATRTSLSYFHTFILSPSLSIHHNPSAAALIELSIPTSRTHCLFYHALGHPRHSASQREPPDSHIRALGAGQRLEAKGRQNPRRQSHIQGERGSQRFAQSLGLVFHLMPQNL